jgi:hypothetical protein
MRPRTLAANGEVSERPTASFARFCPSAQLELPTRGRAVGSERGEAATSEERGPVGMASSGSICGAHRRDPMHVGLTLAGMSELLDAARVASHGAPSSDFQRRLRELSARLALGSLLLSSVRRPDWRRPALAAATLSSVLELGATWSVPGAAGARTRRWTLLLGIRAAALARLLRESARAEEWEAPPQSGSFGGLRSPTRAV